MYIRKIRKHGAHVRSKVREVTATYIASGLGIVVGLSWNEAIKAFIDHLYPPSSDGSLSAKFVYAFALTVIVVFITIYIVRPPAKSDDHPLVSAVKKVPEKEKVDH